MSEQHSPYRRYYDLMTGLLLVVILIDLTIIGYRKLRTSDLEIDRAACVDFPLHVDPNTADSFDLQCLPGMTEKNARAIVEYRKEYQSRFPNRIVFTGPPDLKKVKGISEKKIAQILPYLIFPGQAPQTRPNTP